MTFLDIVLNLKLHSIEKKKRLNVNVAPTGKFFLIQCREKESCVSARPEFFFIVAAEIRIAYSVLKMFNAEIIHYATRVHEKCE